MNKFLKTEDKIFSNALDMLDYRERQLAIFYKEHQKNIVEKIKAYTVDIQSIKRNKYKIARLESLYYDINDEINKLFKRVSGNISTGFKQIMTETYYHSVFNIERYANLSLYNVPDARIVFNVGTLDTEAANAALLEDVGGHTFLERMGDHRLRLQYTLKTNVADAVVEGISTAELARRIQKIEETLNMSIARATMTARTELLRAYSLGAESAASEAEENGVEFQYKWSSTLDQNTRPSHQHADGQIAKIIDGVPAFNINGVLLSSPRVTHPDNTAVATAEVINCRCKRQNLPFGIAPTRRASKMQDGTWKDVNGDMTYEEWYREYYKKAA